MRTQDVLDAVRAFQQQGRAFSQHWNMYMSEEGRAAFPHLASFIEACRQLHREQTGGTL
jgi:hypothetical protein